jgi:hypothetical protein
VVEAGNYMSYYFGSGIERCSGLGRELGLRGRCKYLALIIVAVFPLSSSPHPVKNVAHGRRRPAIAMILSSFFVDSWSH